ncbi:cell division ATPase MinD [Candidatus Woesearchaeota archaeon]|nr:cell division ATPase MinD [Candidatus Woesearchaeota archaeon]
MSETVSIVSGKGGTGKTTAALSLAVAFVNLGNKVVVLDGNLTNPHIGIRLGSPTLKAHIHDVLKGKKKVKEALYQHASGIKVVPGHIAHNPLHGYKSERLNDAVKDLSLVTDIVIIDGPPGLGKEVVDSMKSCDNVIIVTTPELSAVSDALRAIKLAKGLNKHILGVILNRVHNDSLELTAKNVEALLETKIIGIIPEDEAVREANKLNHPVVHSHPNSKAAIAYKNVAAELLGK